MNGLDWVVLARLDRPYFQEDEKHTYPSQLTLGLTLDSWFFTIFTKSAFLPPSIRNVPTYCTQTHTHGKTTTKLHLGYM